MPACGMPSEASACLPVCCRRSASRAPTGACAWSCASPTWRSTQSWRWVGGWVGAAPAGGQPCWRSTTCTDGVMQLADWRLPVAPTSSDFGIICCCCPPLLQAATISEMEGATLLDDQHGCAAAFRCRLASWVAGPDACLVLTAIPGCDTPGLPEARLEASMNMGRLTWTLGMPCPAPSLQGAQESGAELDGRCHQAQQHVSRRRRRCCKVPAAAVGHMPAA